MSEKRFRLMRADLPKLKAVNDCQVLTIGQLTTLFWNTIKPAYKRVKEYVDEGYLEKRYIPQVSLAPPVTTSVYTIGQLGAQVLANTYGYSSEDIHFAGKQISNFKTLQTLLATNNFRVNLTRACHDLAGYELIEWVNESKFRATPDYVRVSNTKGEVQNKPVYPDGFCVIRAGEVISYSYVEVDNGTEAYSQFKSQMETYVKFLQSGIHQERYGTKAVRVLIVTTTKHRRDQLRERTRQVGGIRRFWFTTFEEATREQVLTAPIWLRAEEDSEAHTLMPKAH